MHLFNQTSVSCSTPLTLHILLQWVLQFCTLFFLFFFLMSLTVREFYLNTHYLQCLKNGHYTPERGNQCCSKFSVLCKWRLKSRTCPKYIAINNTPTNHPTNWFSEPSGSIGWVGLEVGFCWTIVVPSLRWLRRRLLVHPDVKSLPKWAPRSGPWTADPKLMLFLGCSTHIPLLN